MSGINEVPPVPEAPSFGEELRKEREMRGISLKEIADATKISRRFLEAIERNDMRTLPAAVFTRGFVREYARYLGLNAEEMVTRYGDFLAAREAADSLTSAAAMTRPLPPPPFRPGAVVAVEPPRTGRYLVAAMVVIVLLSGALVTLLLRRTGAAEEKLPAAQGDAAIAAVPSARPAPPPAPVAGVVMELRFHEATWLSAEADHKPVLSGEFAAGETRTLHATDSIVFKTLGNAGGVDITLNGRKLDSLGRSGDVRHDLRFGPQGLESSRDRT